MKPKMISRQVMINTVGVSLLFLFLYHCALFKSSEPYELAIGNEGLHMYRRKWISDLPSGSTAESIKLQLSRLVRGKDLTELESTGFSCASDNHTEICVISKPVVFDKQSLTIFIPSSDDQNIIATKRTIKPYARKQDDNAMRRVSSIRLLNGNTSSIRPTPACQFTHHVPAVVFSFGGYSYNHFHEVDDVIIPLYITSRHFRSEVQFVITDYRGRLIRKFDKVMKELSNYDVIDADADDTVHCFPAAVVGLRFHDDFVLDSTQIPGGYTFATFRQFLRDSFNLKRSNILKRQKPKIVLISREKTRKILNEDEMVKMMKELGFDVQVASPDDESKMDQFAKIVNSCDIMVGAHGAGLTNDMFLPDGAVLVQIHPLGIDYLANLYFAKPAINMGLKYLAYKVEPNETTLYDQYGPDDPVLSNPAVIWRKGFNSVQQIYLSQNLRINLHRFKGTLLEALALLN